MNTNVLLSSVFVMVDLVRENLMIGCLCFSVWVKEGKKKKKKPVSFTLMSPVPSTNSGHVSVQKCFMERESG